MKQMLKRSLSLLLAIIIVFGSAVVGLGEIDFDNIFTVEAKAANGDCLENMPIIEHGRYTGNVGDSTIFNLNRKGLSQNDEGERFYRYGNKGLNGETYENGFEAWIARWNYANEISWAYAVFDIGGNYNKLTGKTSLIDSYNTNNFDTTIYFYNGNKLLASYRLTNEDYEKNIDVNVVGVEELKILVKDNRAVSGGTSFAIYDLFFDKSVGFKGRKVEFNGHFYQVFDEGRLWTDAKTECEKMGGHLVTITSVEENNFIEKIISGNSGPESYWIGLSEDESTGDLSWVTNEQVEYTNWDEGEPNNGDGKELYTLIYSNRHHFDVPGKWNDTLNGGVRIERQGFVCEWDEYNVADGFSFSKYLFDYHSNNTSDYFLYIERFNNPFGSESMVSSVAGTKFEKAMDAWYAVKSVANPGNSLNTLNYQQQYEMLIYSVLFDTLCNEDVANVSYSNAVTDVSKFTTELVEKWNLADVLDKTDLTGAESEQVKNAAIAFIGNSGTKWTSLGEYTAMVAKVSGVIDKVIKSGVSVYNIIQKVCMMSQLINLGDESIAYLYMLKDYSTDPFMKLAFQEVIDSVSNDWIGIVEKVILDVGFAFNKAALSMVVDGAWASVCAVNPFLAGMAIGDIAGTLFCNVFMATEDSIEQYSNMKKIVELKNAIRTVQPIIYSRCESYMNKKNTGMWVFSLGFMNSVLETDYKASVEFGRISTQAGVVNFFINLFSSKQEQVFDEYKETIENIIKLYNDNYIRLFYDYSVKYRLCLTYPQHYNKCYSTPVSDFEYQKSNGKITITGLSESLLDVVIPDEIDGLPVTALFYDMFENNPDVGIVILGKNVDDISGLDSSYGNNFEYIYADQTNAKYCSVDGVLFSKDKKILCKYTCGLNNGVYNIPDTVTTIGEFAFAWDKNITSVALPNSITSIGGSAFKGCTNLKKLELPSKITSIPGAMCMDCTNLESVTISDGAVNIGGYAFNGCTKLNSIRIPVSLKVVGAFAFKGCDSLKKVDYSGSTTQWNNIEILAGNEPLCNAYGAKPETPVTKATNAIKGINVTWNAVPNAAKYVVYKRLGTSSTWTIIGTTTSTSFADNNASAYGSYYVYSVKAYSSANVPSDYIRANTATIQRVVAPYTKATNVLNGVNVTWGKVAGANKYVVLRRIGTESTWKILGETTGTSFRDTNVTPGIYYLYSIRAVNNTGYSAYDVNKRFTIQRVVAPYTKAANAINGVNVTWGKVAGASKYVVLRRVGTESTWKIIGETTGTSFRDTNVTPGIYYLYSIRAVNGTGYSAYDVNKRFTIQYITAPTARAVNKTSGVDLRWNSVAGATKYNVYRRENGSSTWVYMCTTTSTGFLDRSVVDGRYYTYSIRAINGTGYSAYNSAKCVTIKHI